MDGRPSDRGLSPGGLLILGVFFLLVGNVPVLSAIGVVPGLGDSAIWVSASWGVLTILGGLALMLGYRAPGDAHVAHRHDLRTRVRVRAVQGLILLAIITLITGIVVFATLRAPDVQDDEAASVRPAPGDTVGAPLTLVVGRRPRE